MLVEVLRRIWPLYLSATFYALGQALLVLLVSVRLSLEGVSSFYIGIVSSVYFLGGLIGAVYCARLIESVGHVRAYAGFSALLAILTLAHTLTSSLVAWIVLRAGSGFVAYGLLMACESWLNSAAVPQTRGRILATYSICFFLALSLGQLLLNAYSPVGPQLFIVGAMLFSMSAVPLALVTCEAPAIIRTQRFRTLELLNVSRLGTAGCLVAGFTVSAFYAMAPVFVERSGLDPTEVSVFMAVAIAGGLAFQWPIGWASDRWSRQYVLVVVTAGIIVGALAIPFAIKMNHMYLYTVTFLFGGVLCSLYPLSVAQANDHIEREETVQLSRSLLFVFAIGSTLTGALCGALMASVGPAGVMYLIAFASACLTIFGAIGEKWERRLESVFVVVPQTSAAVAALDPRRHQWWEKERLSKVRGVESE